ncbi:MAG: restriction endonuclease subunit S, partial [Neisseriaceae bacterium]|nr:restriction endonuclease subunit S [Neisseriaceae bacterium]
YRDKLLSEEELEKSGFEWKCLGEVAEKIYAGGTPKTEISEYWKNGTIPWMSSGEVNLGTIYQTEKFITELGLNNSSARFVPKNSVVIALAGQGKTRGKVARTRIDLTTNQSLAALVFDENKINPDYVYYFLTTQYDKLRQASSGNGARGGLNLKIISNYKILIPKSLSKQRKIVEILDQFDTLTQSITAGLPREIELRRKQYEYYRNLLLTFD